MVPKAKAEERATKIMLVKSILMNVLKGLDLSFN